MMRIRGCRVTEELLEAWSTRLVFDPEPIYVTQAARGALPYTTYAMAPEATEVALLSSAQLRALPTPDQAEPFDTPEGPKAALHADGPSVERWRR